MTSYLQNEVTIAAFVKELAGWRTPYGQTAEHKGAGRKRQPLCPSLSVVANQRNPVRLPQAVFRNDKIRMRALEDRAGAFEP
jgi:hypothetical protein